MPDNRGKALPEHVQRQVRRLKLAGNSVRQIARLLQLSTSTVQKYLGETVDDDEAESP
jgi:DNA invertase Pin-like site-specific DNA recombinase